MSFSQSPSIDVNEIDLTTVVPAVATTEAGIAGVFRWGPSNEAILISSEVELVSRFSKPLANDSWQNTETFFSAANFLAYSDALYVVRVNENASVASNASFEGAYEGALGNSISVAYCDSESFESQTSDDTISIFPSSRTGEIVSTNDTAPSYISVGDAIVVDNQRLRIVSIGETVEDADNLGSHLTPVTLSNKYISTVAYDDTFKYEWGYANLFDFAPEQDHFHLVVVDTDGEITGVEGSEIELYENLSTVTGAKSFDGSTNNIGSVLENRSSYVRFVAAPVGAGYQKLSGGSDGEGEKTISIGKVADGYNIFKSAEDIDISLLIGGSPISNDLTNFITDNVVEDRKDVVFCATPQLANIDSYTSQDLVESANAIGASSYLVVDSGYKYQYDKYSDTYRWIPLNGDIAGLCARTDDTRDPWFSPAGYNRGNIKNVVKLALNPNKPQRDLLYKNGINPVITQPGQGTILFGDKTFLNRPSAFDRINVRRLFIVIEKAIARASKSILWEFNDDSTRAQFRNLTEPFLRDVQGRRGITDFRVVCDLTNNTPEVIDRNEFIGDIYVKAARSINFVRLNFVNTRTGVDFEEIVGNF